MIASAAVKIYDKRQNVIVTIPCHRHADAFQILKDFGYRRFIDYNEVAQGFLDENDNFLSRIEAKKAALPGADDAAVKAALEKDPEWNDLVQRVKDLSTAMKEGGRRMDEVIRRRIAPKKKISK